MAMIKQRLSRQTVQPAWIENIADYRFAPCQWETALLCNDVSHWLGASLESAPENKWYFVREREVIKIAITAQN